MMDRRTLLRSTSAAVALPFLPSALARSARAAAPPVRAVWLYFPNGTPEGSWHPRRVDRSGRLRQLNEAMAPLERHRDDLLLFRDVFMPRGNGHGGGTATWLTEGDWDEERLDPGGPSVDQVAARAVGSGSIVPTLTLGTRPEGYFSTSISRNCVSWQDSGRPSFRETDPRVVFQRLFGASPETDASLLDDLREQANALRGRLGREDRAKLDEYLEAIRGVERRIAFAANEATARRLGEARELGLGAPPEAIPEDHGAYLDLLMDLVALALWSGATRLATLMLDHGQSNRYCTFVPGVKGTWHALSHWRDFDGRTEDDDGVTSWSSRRSKKAMYRDVVTWHHERVARLLDRLASLPEGEGRLLDHTLVTYGSNLADGHEHEERDLPLLVAGSGGGAVRTGRRLATRGPLDLSSVHLATLHALGVERRSLGEADEPIHWA